MMKENRKFFENNRLNKGYNRISNFNKTDLSHIRNQFKHVLPPIDLMSEYEEMCPGTLERLLDMAKSEQNHRHSLELLAQEHANRAVKMGRTFSLILVTIISIATILLAILSDEYLAAIFAISAFGTITFISLLFSKTKIKKPQNSNPPRRTDIN